MRTSALLLGVMLLATAPALAGAYFVEVSGGNNGYDMGTVNTFLDSVNDEVGEPAFEHLDSGGSFSVALGQILQRRLVTAIAYERLFAAQESESPAVSMKVQAPANVIRFQLAYALARLGSVVPFIQGGIGIAWNNGHVEYRDEFGNDRRHDFEGNALTVEGLAGLEVRLNDRWGVNVAGGYRVADIDSPDWEAESFGGYGEFTGPGFDYTGAMVRVGVRIGLNWQSGEDEESDDAEPKREAPQEATGWM